VVGVEFVDAACRAFFEEHGIAPAARTEGGATRYDGGGMTLLAADFLETRPDGIGTVDAFYDRAAAVALPASIRDAYAAHLAALVRPGARGLMVTFEYDQSAADGPPFSVPDDEVRSTWGRHFEMEHLDAGPVAGLPERFGGVAARKSVWRLVRRS
jgi:thiopurine S-methyltransferase